LPRGFGMGIFRNGKSLQTEELMYKTVWRWIG
jgi:hypothetical protein